MRTELRLEMLSRIHHHYPPLYCLFIVSSSQKTGFHCSSSALQWFNQRDPVLERYQAERSGTTYKDQSTTEFRTTSMEVRLVTAASRGFFFSPSPESRS